MARRDQIQYVRYYAAGTAAHKIEQEPIRRKKAKPVPVPREERIAIPFDPVAVFGTAVAVVMIICVLIGFAQVNRVNGDIARMETYMSTLRSERYGLQKEYDAGYNLAEIRTAAEAMGLVPIEQVRHITIQIPEPEVATELPWWQELWNSFTALFE